MKQMTCAQMGGPATCTTVISGNTAQEMVDNGMKHLKEAHPEMLADMDKMSDDDKAKWMADFQAKFDAAPTM